MSARYQLARLHDNVNASEPFAVDGFGNVLAFDKPQDAAAMAQELNKANKGSGSPVRFRVVKIEDTEASTVDWRARERQRFTDGTYKPVPWAGEAWFVNSPFANLHFPHVSTGDNPSQMAYTESEEKGAADRQLRIRPGRYLEKHFYTVLSRSEIADWAAKYGAENEANELQFARTADEIEDVYTNGPNSCMAHKAEDYASPFHPVRVYASPDIAIAYTTREGRVTARAVCFPEKKLYGSVYGDATRLKDLLTQAGYEFRSTALVGARMVRHECDGGGFVVPYVDSVYAASDDGEWLIIDRGGDINCEVTDGVSAPCSRCDRCGSRMDEDDSYYIRDREENWCCSCYEDHTFYCEDCDETYSDSVDSYCVHGRRRRERTVCEDCARSNYSQCEDCGEWHHDDNTCYDIDANPVCKGCQDDRESAPCGELLSATTPQCECRECRDHRASEEEDSNSEDEEESSEDGDEEAAPAAPTPEYVRQREREAATNDPRQLALPEPPAPYPALPVAPPISFAESPEDWARRVADTRRRIEASLGIEGGA